MWRIKWLESELELVWEETLYFRNRTRTHKHTHQKKESTKIDHQDVYAVRQSALNLIALIDIQIVFIHIWTHEQETLSLDAVFNHNKTNSGAISLLQHFQGSRLPTEVVSVSRCRTTIEEEPGSVTANEISLGYTNANSCNEQKCTSEKNKV